MNPFLHGMQGNTRDISNNNTNGNGNSEYVNDISVQEKYLIPQNSNFYC